MISAQPEHYVFYVVLTLGFVFLLWLVNLRTRPLGMTVILWGILVVIFSSGYALIGVPATVIVAPALLKIGFLLVLGGVAWSMLFASPGSTASQGVDHV